MTEREILSALSTVKDTDIQKDIVSLGFVRNVRIDQGRVGFDLVLPTPLLPSKELLREEIKRVVQTISGVSAVQVVVRSDISRKPTGSDNKLPNIKNIVAIGSGKGGVGKSTVSVNLAVGLAKHGAKVGLLDGDIYGPSLPIMLGATDKDLSEEGGRIVPVSVHGIKFMSFGFMAKGDQPLIWRGPMAHKAVQESFFRVDWGDLDYLLVDMPPGTGDVHLTLVQSVPLVGAVIVSTPQDVGLTISMKTFRMFEKTHVHPLGIIENMSHHICSHCGSREEIFGYGMVRKEAQKLNIPFLGEIPLDIKIRQCTDEGVPIVLTGTATPIGKTYLDIIERVVGQISLRNYQERPIQMIEEPEENAETFSV